MYVPWGCNMDLRCHTHMYHWAVTWTSDVAYVHAVGLRGVNCYKKTSTLYSNNNTIFIHLSAKLQTAGEKYMGSSVLAPFLSLLLSSMGRQHKHKVPFLESVFLKERKKKAMTRIKLV